MSRHRCPVRRCKVQLTERFLMCPPHWRAVPRDLQRAVNAAYADGEGVGSVELLLAQADAVRAVHEALGLTEAGI